MPFISRPRRARRQHEWSADKAVTFIVSLAASGSVTLAAKRAGMSRKSAYALKARDSAFAAAWGEAVRARAVPAEGDKAHKADRPPSRPGGGDRLSAPARRPPTALERDLFFAQLARRVATCG
jgi:hypothetical protein